MGMRITGIYLQFFKEFAPKLVFRKHPLDRQSHEFLRLFRLKVPGCNLFKTTDIAAVAVIYLAVHFAPRQGDFIRINNDDPITGIDMGRIQWIVFATQPLGDLSRKPAKHGPFCIKKAPLLLVVRSFSTICIFFHLRQLLNQCNRARLNEISIYVKKKVKILAQKAGL
jgi:hypothetical protein